MAGSLAAVEAAGTDALAAMRRMVGILRTDPVADAHRLPIPQLGDLAELVARFRAGGAAGEVELRVDGDGAVLPTEVQAEVYRVVQESLTNVARHARRAARVVVHVACTGTGAGAGVRVRVADTRGRAGPVPAPAGGGLGVLNMRERVAARGGTLTAGVHEGGWAVDAALPASASTDRSRRDG